MTTNNATKARPTKPVTDSERKVQESNDRQHVKAKALSDANEAIRNASNRADIAGGTLLRFSPLSRDFENALEFTTQGEDWAKGIIFVAVPITTASKQDVIHACRFDSMRGYVNDKGESVIDLPYPVSDLLGTPPEVRSFVAAHMAAHAKSIAKAIDGKGVVDTDNLSPKAKAKALAASKGGRHSAAFKEFASDYFSEFTDSERKTADNRPMKMQPAHAAKMGQFRWNESAWAAFVPRVAKAKDDDGKHQVKWILHQCPNHPKTQAKLPEGARYVLTCPKKVKKQECGTKLVQASKIPKVTKKVTKKVKATK
jgi:hypothetical protein